MKRESFCILLATAALVACSNPKTPNEANFGQAIEQYLTQKGELCLSLHEWPAKVGPYDKILAKSMPNSRYAQLLALQSQGLVAGSEDANGNQLFSLTDAGMKFYREKEVNSYGFGAPKKVMQGDICYGHKTLDKVTKWDGPIKLGDYQEAKVKYTYKIRDLASWTSAPEIQTAFPYIKSLIERASTAEQAHLVKLSSEGWEPKGIK